MRQRCSLKGSTLLIFKDSLILFLGFPFLYHKGSIYLERILEMNRKLLIALLAVGGVLVAVGLVLMFAGLL